MSTNMKEKVMAAYTKAKDWSSRHKKELIIGGTIVGAAVTYIAIKAVCSSNDMASLSLGTIDTNDLQGELDKWKVKDDSNILDDWFRKSMKFESNDEFNAASQTLRDIAETFVTDSGILNQLGSPDDWKDVIVDAVIMYGITGEERNGGTIFIPCDDFNSASMYSNQYIKGV